MEDGTVDDGHRYFEDLAVAHVVGGLDESDGRVFRSHLLECSDCRARVWELRALAHDLADVERDERRTRAAKVLETKEREEDEGEEAAAPAPSNDNRLPRAVLLVGLAVILTLAAWNFTLRGTVARQDQVIDDLQTAGQVLRFGTEGDVIRAAPQVRGSLMVDGTRVVLLVEGLVDDEAYGIYFLDRGGEVLRTRAELASSGALQLFMRLEPGTVRMVVTELEGGPTAQPTGARVFEAAVPTGS
jgi:hypothetical protein